MLVAAHGDPDLIAAQMITTGRATDPRIWTEIQQTLGNATAGRIRGTLARQAEIPAEAPAAPTLPAQVEREVLGVVITAPAGVVASSLDEVTRIVQAEVGNNEYAQKHFQKSKVSIVIIPAHVAMTDVPELTHLKGQKTFDGRDWSTVRGMGGTPTPNGRFSVAVAEENAVAVANTKTPYPATYSIAMHELAHVLESKGMTKQQQARVKELYAAHIKRDPDDAAGTFTDRYGSENEQEYFAQSTNAFFGRNVMGTNHSGRPWLQANDPDMYAFLVDLYDNHHDKKGA